MTLTFIGQDGSLGLRHGKRYYVEVTTFRGMIVATIHDGFARCRCPYSSPQTFAANWKK